MVKIEALLVEKVEEKEVKYPEETINRWIYTFSKDTARVRITSIINLELCAGDIVDIEVKTTEEAGK